MFRQLREAYGLTRSELAELTNRSPNYILKAESLTFPTPPVALMDFYTQEVDKLPAGLPPGLSETWEPQDRDILNSQYRASQRSHREQWLHLMDPVPVSMLKAEHSSFCRSWVYKILDHEDEDFIHPTEYRVSQGLCIPAPAVYRAEKFGHISQPIKTALSDLVEYVASGRFHAVFPETGQAVTTGVLMIAKKYGVVPYHV